MNLFDILGPVMVGPSSSHTAGAVRIGRVARLILGSEPVEAKFLLHGSFAMTGEGHGTKQALVAGLLGMRLDDEQIPESFRIAEERGLEFSFGTCTLRDAHPNSVLVFARGEDGAEIKIGAASLGGARIEVFQYGDIRTTFNAELPTLLITNQDAPGCVSLVTSLLAREGINLATLELNRDGRGEHALMVIECDNPVPERTVTALRAMPDILSAVYFLPSGIG